MKIVFYSNQLSERGTETALIDYARANKKILNNESILAFPANKILDYNRYNFLKEEFEIILFDNVVDFNQDLINKKIDLVYLITDGIGYDLADKLVNVKTFVHAVFSTRRKHGTYYCAIHQFLNYYYHTNYPVLPHIVNKMKSHNESFRTELSIPSDATVYGCYGGKDRFNIKFVHKVIHRVAKSNENIFFIFMNIENFIEKEYKENLKNVIFLPGSTDEYIKVKFINSCDAMLHARDDGETFGLSVAEFSTFNKPILTYKPNIWVNMFNYLKSIAHRRLAYSTAHIMNLGEKGFYYSNKMQLYNLIINMSKNIDKLTNYDCFTENFNEDIIIKKFNEIINF